MRARGGSFRLDRLPLCISFLTSAILNDFTFVEGFVSPQTIDFILLVSLSVGTVVAIVTVKSSRAREYARYRPVIDDMNDDELVRAVSSGRFRRHSGLSEHAINEVLRRRLMIVQLDAETVSALRENLKRSKAKATWRVVALLIIQPFAMLALAISSASLIFLIRLTVNKAWEPFLGGVVKSLTAGAAVYLFYKLLVVWRRIRAVGALSSMAERPREQPVVYLRSFSQERAGRMMIGEVTEEEQLASIFDMFGPFVAIGRPRDVLPQVGAARLYVSDSKWQAVAAELMSKARLVVLRVGHTEGFWWEFERAVRQVEPQRLLLLVPRDKDLYAQIRIRANKMLAVRLPEYVEGLSDKAILGGWLRRIFFMLFPSVGHLGSLRGIIYFEPGRTPHFIKMGMTLRGELKASGRAALVVALQPMLERLNMALFIPPVSKFRVILLCVSIGYLIIVLSALVGQLLT